MFKRCRRTKQKRCHNYLDAWSLSCLGGEATGDRCYQIILKLHVRWGSVRCEQARRHLDVLGAHPMAMHDAMPMIVHDHSLRLWKMASAAAWLLSKGGNVVLGLISANEGGISPGVVPPWRNESCKAGPSSKHPGVVPRHPAIVVALRNQQ